MSACQPESCSFTPLGANCLFRDSFMHVVFIPDPVIEEKTCSREIADRLLRTSPRDLMVITNSGLSPTVPATFIPVFKGLPACAVGHSRASSALQASGPNLTVTHTIGKWPWVFQNPGRCADLPAEEVFSGFEELLSEDLGDAYDEQDDQAYRKVSRDVRNACYTYVSLDAAPAPKVVALSEAAAGLTGIPFDLVLASRSGKDEDGAQLQQVAHGLTGTNLEVYKGSRPFSSSYGGTQFGNWAGQLGDGRVCTLGEIQVAEGAGDMEHNGFVEVQLKGIGKTPFSRGGDGKAVLGACMREFLFSEAFLGLGLPAAIAVSVCLTGEDVTVRDPDPRNSGALKRARGAVLCRAAPSFLRFGSFELPARRGDVELVKKLGDFCLRHLVPHLKPNVTRATGDWQDEGRMGYGDPLTHRQDQDTLQDDSADHHDGDRLKDTTEQYLGLLVAIIQATARMVAGWQAFGFCHGVLNTDNFTCLGLALDFGPCSFMEEYDPAWSPNEGDSALRYAFQNQPDVSAWNCERLAEAFSPVVGVSGVVIANEVFSRAFDIAYTALLQQKFGLCGMELGSGWIHPSRSRGEAAGATHDAQFVLEFFRLMSSSRADFTGTWRALVDVPALSVARKSQQLSGAPGQPATRGGKFDNVVQGGGQIRASETQEGTLDEKMTLRPLKDVLLAAGASSDQMREWASWIHEFSSRIDTQGIGKDHPDGEEKGREARLEIMQKSSPAFVLRADDLTKALEAAESGDMVLVHQLEQRLSRAYTADRS